MISAVPLFMVWQTNFTGSQLKVYETRTYDGLPLMFPPGGAMYYGGIEIRVRAMEEVGKGERWMPRLLQAMKDVISCEKPR